MKITSDIFIHHSHATKDQKLANKLESYLTKANIKTITLRDFKSEFLHIKNIANALNATKYTILIISQQYMNSDYHHLNRCIAEMPDNTRFREKLISILRESRCKLPSRLKKSRYIDFTINFDEAFQQLLKVLKKKLLGIQKGIHKPEQNNQERKKPLNSNINKNELINHSSPESILDLTHDGNKSKIPASEQNLLFVMMPYKEKWSTNFYNKHILQICTSIGITAKRADNIPCPAEPLLEFHIDIIKRARLILADLTTQNANVMIEVGIALAMNKKIIFITQSMEYVPSEIEKFRPIEYNLTPTGKKKFKDELKNTIQAILRKNEII